MTDQPSSADDEVHDVVGIGFGPSNLALAVALQESSVGRGLRFRFVERQQCFGWHRGMLLEDATMQISYLKDLATLRNPASRFTFLAYLHARDRLVDFINYGSAFPTRLEFHDYLEWAADAFAEHVEYGVEVTAVCGGTSGDVVEVHTRRPDGSRAALLARNVVLATGLDPELPKGVHPGPRVWHSRDLLLRAPGLEGTSPRRLVVVGAGQSAAEALDYLHRAFPDAEICAVFARYGYSPADDSAFANRIFDPEAVDRFYAAPGDVKEMLLGYHANTNYSVVDPDLIDALYRRHYHERVAGRERLRFLNVCRVTDVLDLGDQVELVVESLIDGRSEVLAADAVVYATGYRSSDPLRLLDEQLAAACRVDEVGRLRIHRDYRVATLPTLTAGIYVQGATEHTHGITSTLLSTVAARAGEIVDSLATAVPAPSLAG